MRFSTRAKRYRVLEVLSEFIIPYLSFRINFQEPELLMSATPEAINRNPSLTPLATPPTARDESVHIPARWRMGQAIVIGLIALLALYYATVGYRSNQAAPGTRDVLSPFDFVGFLVLGALVWMTTPTAGVIAMATFREALRRRWMTVLLVFGLVLIALSVFFTSLSPGTEGQFIRDFGTGFIIIMTTLMAIFLGVSLVPPEIERRTIFTILSKPVTRAEFLIGKYLGLCLTLLTNLFLLTAMFLLAYTIFIVRQKGMQGAMVSVPGGDQSLAFNLVNLSKAMMLQYGQLMILASLALLLSLLVSNMTAIVFCFVVYFGGQMSAYWEHLGQHAGRQAQSEQMPPAVQNFVKIVYFILPRLDRFDVRTRLVGQLPVEFNYMWKSFGSGIVYSAVLLIISYLVFSDREF
jgi:ABC-type transport system involved in multi-copper enzyme maturation permease subunit